MMVIIYKNEGETQLGALDRLRVEQPQYKNAVLSYAGRLDPMAEGQLLVLVDEENKNREKYLGLGKEYEVEILFGGSTDTGDILGLVVDAAQKDINISEADLAGFIGKFSQPYPHYSSKTVNGKPLFQWAREGRLDEIEIPEREAEIYSIELLKNYSMSGKEILSKVKERVAKVKGDFRQNEIVASWENLYNGNHCAMIPIVKIRVKCSSGTYMRSLAEAIGAKMGSPSLAWTIKRTRLLLSSK